MDTDQKLLKMSIKLVKLFDKMADESLPRQIVDVVKLHSKLAVGSAWIPVPGADIAAGAGLTAIGLGFLGVPLAGVAASKHIYKYKCKNCDHEFD